MTGAGWHKVSCILLPAYHRTAEIGTDQPSPTTPWPKASGTPMPSGRKHAWCTISVAPTRSTAPHCSGWQQHQPRTRRWRGSRARHASHPGDRHRQGLQRYNSSRTENAQGHARSEAHDPAHPSRDVINWAAINQFPNQKYVGRIHQEEGGRIEGNWLWCQFTYGHPSGGERQQRHRKKMRKIEPHQTRRGFRRVEQEVMVIGQTMAMKR